MSTLAPSAAGHQDPFEEARPRLLGLAYRMLGTLGDAEDVVQEAWLRWNAADRGAIANVAGWLTTVTTRLALDRLKSAQRRREEYVGPWLPEPLITADGPEAAAEVADSLTLGFLTLLDRLGPVERAVFLLADVFGVPYSEVAQAVGKSEVACRQIASRSRRRLQEGAHPRKPTGEERRVFEELVFAMAVGDMKTVVEKLAPDAVCISDGGGIKRAGLRPVVGAERVARFIVNVTKKVYGEARVVATTVNGDPGMIVYVDDVVDCVLAFEVDGDRVASIWIVRNPDKLDHVLVPVALA